MNLTNRFHSWALAALLQLAWGAAAADTVPAGDTGAEAAGGTEAPRAESAQSSPWSGTLGVGTRYDSNVAILDIDTRAGAADYLAQLELGGAYTWNPAGGARVRAGYDLSQSLYSDYSNFNLRMHRLSLDASHELAGSTAGVLGNWVHASLDGSEFMVFRQVSPYLSRLVGQRLFLRGAYAWTDKSFADNPTRDADSHALSVDAFVFVDGLRTYLVFGARRDHERAVADRFDYDGTRLSAQLVRRVEVGDRQLVTRARLRHERRSYRAPDPSIGERRLDERTRLEGVVEVPLTERTGMRASWEYSDNRSNLPAVDFSKHLVSLMFNASF